jgi:hypothetical protein
MMPKLFTLDEVAAILRYVGTDRQRSVRRAFSRYGVPILRRDRGTFLVTEQQIAALMEAMKCSQSVAEVACTTSGARSVSAARPASSKSTLRDAIAKRMPTPTVRSSKGKSGPKCFMVLAGGRKG